MCSLLDVHFEIMNDSMELQPFENNNSSDKTQASRLHVSVCSTSVFLSNSISYFNTRLL